MKDNEKKNEIMVFDNPEFGQVRSIEIDGEPWLVGKDVATALGYSNPRDALATHIDDEDKATVAIHDGSQNRNMTIINESGVYALIFSSQLPNAKRFKRWVTSKVLPAIRKNGMYVAGENTLSTEAQQAIAIISNKMNEFERKISKIERETSYSNYYLRLQMRSGYDENWERRQSRNLKSIAEFIGTDEKKILKDIYKEMENRYGVCLNEFCNDYKRVKGLTFCSTLSVISFSFALREMFDAVIGEVMDVCGIYRIETEAGISPLMQVAMMAARLHRTDAGTYSGK